jgi:hypothetical protein
MTAMSSTAIPLDPWGCWGGDLVLGLAVNTSMWARARLPVANGPRTKSPPQHFRHLFKSNSGSPNNLEFQDDTHVAKGVLHLPSGPYETGSFIRVPRDGFTTCPEGRCGTPLAAHLPLHSCLNDAQTPHEKTLVQEMGLRISGTTANE